MTPQEVIAKLEADPEFAKFSYQEQVQIRAKLLPDYLTKDPAFLALNAGERTLAFQQIVTAAPVLEDKGLGEEMRNLAALSQDKNNPQSKKATDAMAAYAANGRMIAQSVVMRGLNWLESTISKMEYPNAATWEQMRRFQSANPHDAAKVSDYFEGQLTPDTYASKYATFFRDAAPILGNLMDWAVVGPMIGSAESPGTLGKLLVGGVQAAAKQSTVVAQRVLLGVAKRAILSGAVGAIGVARENALAVLNQADADPDMAYTIKKNLKWFGEYYLGDMIFNAAFDSLGPILKGASHIFFPTGRTLKGAFKGATEEQVRTMLGMVIRGEEIPQTMLALLKNKEGIRALQASARVIQNMGSATPEDIFSTVMGRFGYMATKEDGFIKVTPVVRDADPKKIIEGLKFKDVQAAQQWFVQEGLTPGRGMYPAEGLASQTFKEARVADASLTREAHYTAVKEAVEQGYIVRPEVLAGAPDLLPLHLRPLVPAEPAAGAFAADLTENLKGKVKNPAAVDTLVRLFVPDKEGTFNPERLQAFMRHYGRVVGATADDVGKLKIIPSADGTKLTMVTPRETVDFPTTGAKEENVLLAVTSAVDQIVPEGKKVYAGGKAVQLNLGYSHSIMDQKLFTPAWADGAAETLGLAKVKNADGTFSLLNKQGGIEATGTTEDIKLALVKKSIDEPYLKAFLAEQGYTLGKKAEGDYYVLKPGSASAVAKGPTIETLLTGHPELMPKVPSQLGPQMTVVVPGKRVDILYSKGVAVGNYQDLLKALDSYSNTTLKSTKVSLHVGKSGYVYANKVTKQLDIFIPEISYRKSFPQGTPLEEVKAYLETGWKDAVELKKIANQKGYLLQPWNGKWLLHSDGDSFLAANTSEVHAILQKAPIPEWAPELSGLTEESLIGMVPPDGSFAPKDWVDPTRTPSGWDIRSQIYNSPIFWMEKWVAHGGDVTHLNNLRAVEHGRTVAAGADQQASVLAHTIFAPGGKLIKEERRLFIGEYLRAPAGVKEGVSVARGLTQDELRAAGQLRELWDGLFTKFGVDPKKFIEDYFPHIEAYVLKNPLKQYTEGQASKLMRDVFGPTPPKEIRAFFKYSRFSDILQVSMEHDPLKAMLKYTTVGNRQLYMGPAWADAVRSISTSADDVGGVELKRYLNDVMGLPQSSTEAILRKAALQTFVKYGTSQGLGNDLIKNAMSLGYVAALGFNPWKAMRNYLDMFITVAPRLGLEGNKDIIAALHFIKADRKGEFFDALKAKGVLTSGQPVSGGEALVETGAMKKILDSGMAWYKNSDDLTRAAAYKAASLHWERAQGLYEAGLKGDGRVMTEDAFSEMSGLSAMAPDLANQARQLIQQGKWSVAKELHAVNFVKETLFPFRAGLAPQMFRGTVGKLFGMMGHYPIYYIENIRRAIKYGSTASKIAFASMFLGNSAILYASLQTIGIDGSTYLPWNPAQFSGGPYYQMLNQGLQAFGKGYQGRQARAELFGLGTTDGHITWDPGKGNLFKWLVPGSFEMMKWQSAVDLYNQGDSWGALVSLGGATPNSDWLSTKPQ